MRKLIFTILLSLVCILQSQAQYRFPFYSGGFQENSSGESHPWIQGKPRFHASIGSSYSLGTGNIYGISTFATPMVSYDLSKRFSLSAGITYRNTYFGNISYPGLDGEIRKESGSISSLTIFGEGTYRLSNRITVSGFVYKEIPVMNELFEANPLLRDYLEPRQQGFRMDVGYRITDHLQFEAGFGYHKGPGLFIDPYPLYSP